MEPESSEADRSLTTPQTQQEDLEILRIFFELFDKNKNGFVRREDLMTIMFGYCGQNLAVIDEMLAGLKLQQKAQYAEGAKLKQAQGLQRPEGVEHDGMSGGNRKRRPFREE